MQEIMRLAHEFLQNFCAGNQQNQALLHKHTTLFLSPGVGLGLWAGLRACTPCLPGVALGLIPGRHLGPVSRGHKSPQRLRGEGRGRGEVGRDKVR